MYIRPTNRSMLSMSRWQAIAIFLAFFILMGIVGRMDYEDQLLEEQHYCEMVKIWEDDRARGVPAEQRAGWPPFKGKDATCPNL